jgi:uncharacterized protein with FMN-binding domain
MSIKARVAAAIASAGVLGAGWAVGTANGTTLTTGDAVVGTTSTSSTGSGTATTRATTTTSSYKDGTYTGTTATHRYGSVTVTVTISGGKITNVTSNVASDGQGKSNQINSSAVPTIRARVIAANSAGVSTVSGATYTTGAYLTSLQSALSRAA